MGREFDLLRVRMVWVFVELLVLSVSSTRQASGPRLVDFLRTLSPSHEPKLVLSPPEMVPLDQLVPASLSVETSSEELEVQARMSNLTLHLAPGVLSLSNITAKLRLNASDANALWNIELKGVFHVGGLSVKAVYNPNGTLSTRYSGWSIGNLLSPFLQKTDQGNVNINLNTVMIHQLKLTAHFLERHNYWIRFRGWISIERRVCLAEAFVYVNETEPIPFFMIDCKGIVAKTLAVVFLTDFVLKSSFFDDQMRYSPFFNSESERLVMTYSPSVIDHELIDVELPSVLLDVFPEYIPAGVAFYRALGGRLSRQGQTANAFLVDHPNYEWVLGGNKKLPVNQIILRIVKIHKPIDLPDIIKDSTSIESNHISLNQLTRTLSIFVHTREQVEFFPGLLWGEIIHVVLKINMNMTKVCRARTMMGIFARGRVTIENRTMDINYKSDTTCSDHGRNVTVTGSVSEISIEEISKNFAVRLSATEESNLMLINTELDGLVLRNAQLTARDSSDDFPYVSITGLVDLPALENDLRVELVVVEEPTKRHMMLIVHLRNTPLTSVIEALTGMRSDTLPMLRSSVLSTTLLVTSIDAVEKVPMKYRTLYEDQFEPEGGVQILSEFAFPSDCGDDHICTTAKSLFSNNNVFKLKGFASFQGMTLVGKYNSSVKISSHLVLNPSYLNVRFDKNPTIFVSGSTKVASVDLDLDVSMYLNKDGVVVNFSNNRNSWNNPFGIPFLVFSSFFGSVVSKKTSEVNQVVLQGIAQLTAGLEGNSGVGTLSLRLDFGDIWNSSFNIDLPIHWLQNMTTMFGVHKQLPILLRNAKLQSGIRMTGSPVSHKKIKLTTTGNMTLLNETVYSSFILQRGYVGIQTMHFPRPISFADGLLVIQSSEQERFLGPRLSAHLDRNLLTVRVSGYATMLDLIGNVNMDVHDRDWSFRMGGKLLNLENVDVVIKGNGFDTVKVAGCIGDLPEEVQSLLRMVIETSSNRSVLEMKQALSDFHDTEHMYQRAKVHELTVQSLLIGGQEALENEMKRFVHFDTLLLKSCHQQNCSDACYGCLEQNSCHSRDIFGGCIPLTEWKHCCRRDTDPVCMAGNEACRIVHRYGDEEIYRIKTVMDEEKEKVNSLRATFVEAVEDKGKYEAMMEASKEVRDAVFLESSPGLTAANTIKNFGPVNTWVQFKSVCFDSSIETLAGGCFPMVLSVELFGKHQHNLWIKACLSRELPYKLVELVANKLYPGMMSIGSLGYPAEEISGKDVLLASDHEPVQGEDTAANVDYTHFRVRRKAVERARNDMVALVRPDRPETLSVKGLLAPLSSLREFIKKMRMKRILSKSKRDVFGKARNRLFKKWKVPDSPIGRCRIFRQLVDICGEISNTVGHLSKGMQEAESLYNQDSKKLHDQLRRFEADLEVSIEDLKFNNSIKKIIKEPFRSLDDGLRKWDNEIRQEFQTRNKTSIRNWIFRMNQKISELGGIDVDRFLENLFQAFEALFETEEVIRPDPTEMKNVMNAMKQVSSRFDQIFNSMPSLTQAAALSTDIAKVLRVLKRSDIFCRV